MEKSTQKILILTERWFPDTFGGSERVAFWQAEGLKDAGFDVTVFSSNYQKGLKREEKINNINIIRAGTGKNFPSSVMYDILKASKKPMAELLKKENFDLVIIHHPLLGSVYEELEQIKIPVVYIFHSSRPQEIRFEGPTRKYPLNKYWTEKVARLSANKEQLVLNRSNKILYLSKFSEKILKKEYPEYENKIEHLTAGIPKSMFQPNFERDFNKNLFFTIRRLTPRMGLDNLVKAARILDMKNIDFKVEIAGTGHMKEQLENMIEVYQLKDKVKLLGRISDEELEKKYREASAFVLPTTGLEGLGIVTLESLFSGCPVLGTPAGATPELLEPIDRGLVFKEIDYKSIAEKMEWYINLEAEKKKAFSKKGYQFVLDNFTSEKMNGQLTAICRSLLE